MLATDPSEAVHSELILPTTDRYFDRIYHKKIGGALAYEILTFNSNFWQCNEQERVFYINFLLDKDEFYTKNTNISFFDYFICCPKKNYLIKSYCINIH
jgi:hypothetical protein